MKLQHSSCKSATSLLPASWLSTFPDMVLTRLTGLVRRAGRSLFATLIHTQSIKPSTNPSFIYSINLSFIPPTFHSFHLSFIHSINLSFIPSIYYSFHQSFIHSINLFYSFHQSFIHSVSP